MLTLRPRDKQCHVREIDEVHITGSQWRMRKEENPIRSNTTISPQVPLSPRPPPECRLLVEDRRDDPFFFLFWPFFQVSDICLSYNACPYQIHFGGEVRFSSDRHKPSMLYIIFAYRSDRSERTTP